MAAFCPCHRVIQDANGERASPGSAFGYGGGWEVDLERQVVTRSDEVCRIHDMPPGTSIPLAEAIDYCAPEYRETIGERFRACAEEGVPFDVELQIITAIGRRVWVRALGAAVRNSAGKIVRVQGGFQDISERKRTEAELDRHRHHLEELLAERTADLREAETKYRTVADFAYEWET